MVVEGMREFLFEVVWWYGMLVYRYCGLLYASRGTETFYAIYHPCPLLVNTKSYSGEW